MQLELAVFGFLLAGFAGWSLHPREENCPAAVLGYDCKGNRCDHSEVELRKAQLVMAKNRQDRDRNTTYKFRP